MRILKKIREYELHDGGGVSITRIKYGNVLDPEKKHLIIADSNGFIRIIETPSGPPSMPPSEPSSEQNAPIEPQFIKENFTIKSTFDLSENGAIWALLLADVNGDGLEEIIVGGMGGNVLCLSGTGKEIWKFNPVAHHCQLSVNGLYVWEQSPLLKLKNDIGPIIVASSLDGSLRVFDKHGTLIWSQLFSAGISDVIFADTNGDGKEEVIAAGNDGSIRVFEGQTGDLLWFKQQKANVRSTVFHNNLIFYGGDEMKLSVIDTLRQEEIYTQQLKDYIWYLDTIDIGKHDVLFLSTYSFRPLGMEDGTDGHPFCALYLIKNEKGDIGTDKRISLEKIMEFSDFNAQEYYIIKEEPQTMALADTSGKILIINLRKLIEHHAEDSKIQTEKNNYKLEGVIEEFTLPEFVNTIMGVKRGIEKDSEIIFWFGADKGKIFEVRCI